MAWVPAAISGGSAIVGGLLGNKGAKQGAQQASQAQEQLAQQMFNEATQYQAQQEQALRNAISGVGQNAYFQVPGQASHQFIAPPPSFTSAPPPGTFQMSSPQAANKTPQNLPQSLPNKQPAPSPGQQGASTLPLRQAPPPVMPVIPPHAAGPIGGHPGFHAGPIAARGML